MISEMKEQYELEELYRKRLKSVPGKEAKEHADHHFAEVFIALGKDPKVAETVFEIGERFGAISAERLLEASIDHLGTPQFDFLQLADLFRDAHHRMGRLAAGYWAKSYGEVVKTGFDPEEYFRAVDKMAEIGGNRLSGYYAYVFPGLLKSGENPYTARSYAT